MAVLDPNRWKYSITGSKANIIMGGSNSDVLDLFLEDIGEKEPEDLRMNLAVQLGLFLGDFILDWCELTDRYQITERQRFVRHPVIPECAVTLDGYRAFDNSTWEAKHCNPYTELAELVRYYTPQALVQKSAREADRAYLAILRGLTLHIVEVEGGVEYEREMWAQLMSYALCVKTMTPPSPVPRIVPPDRWKSVNLNVETPNWGPEIQVALETFCKTSKAAQINGIARESVKALLPDDVGNLTWNDVVVKRARNGAVSIKQEAA